MNKLKIISVLLSSAFLSACSDINEYAKETGKCRLAADIIGDTKAVMVIDEKFASYLARHSDEMADMKDPNTFKKELALELGLDNPTSMFTAFRIIKTYNSCTDLHEQPKKPAPSPSLGYYISYPFL